MDKIMERIAKLIARSGVCSRRDAEKLIEQGRITVNGETITSPALNVSGEEKILVDGEKLPQKDNVRLWLYYKPLNVLTSNKDAQGRKTVFEILPHGMPRVISVGRLDLNSEGLLLLTNDGGLARQLELPSNGWSRRYKVKVHGFLDEKKLKDLSNGVEVEGVKYGPVKVEIETRKNTNTWLMVTIHEGKNREVRRVMNHVGLDVARLIRVSYGPFQLGSMKENEVKEVAQKALKEQLGGKIKI